MGSVNLLGRVEICSLRGPSFLDRARQVMYLVPSADKAFRKLAEGLSRDPTCSVELHGRETPIVHQFVNLGPLHAEKFPGLLDASESLRCDELLLFLFGHSFFSTG